jgi:hypothetical protein
MKKIALYINIFIVIICTYGLGSCKKEIKIPPPSNAITTEEVFADSADANSAIEGIYNTMYSNGIFFGNGAILGSGGITFMGGSSSDELIPFQGFYSLLYTNQLTNSDGSTPVTIWEPAYSNLYIANSCIENLEVSKNISIATKNQLSGEAIFMRAFNDFYLVNFYGDIPLVTTSNYLQVQTLARTAKASVYQAIISDLKTAQALLRDDYSISNGERVRVNKWAATALLARVYLYSGDLNDAISQATQVINNTSLFSLVPDLNSVFLKNNSEAILQFEVNPAVQPFNATIEGFNIVPSAGYVPNWYLTPQLLSAFETGDHRRLSWVDSTNVGGTEYYFPYKYKIGPDQAQINTPATEYYMVLRLAEQYLIRADANAQLGNLTMAINDLNIIRQRAGLPALSTSLSKDQVVAAVAQERRIELFAEWGHRWLDLKRTGMVNAVMSVVTPLKVGSAGGWKSYQQLYPILQHDLNTDPNLRQNPGY